MDVPITAGGACWSRPRSATSSTGSLTPAGAAPRRASEATPPGGSVWYLGRQEALVGDEQFLKSMIPHHSRAILVCQEADITDPQIVELCGRIVQTQREEIAEMKGILERY